jgi:hypothetical protein
MHPPPETERPATLGQRERARGNGNYNKQEQHLADAPRARKTDRPQTDERLLKTDAVAHSREKVRQNG